MGSKSSRHFSETNESLSRETIDELCKSTGFSEEELLTWHTNFHKDCPDGRLTLKQFEHEYSKIMGKPTQKTMDYVKHMFNVYDKDKNQFIDFREFVTAISAASTTNRLRLVETLFSIFDLDANGRISKDEMSKMLHSLVEVTTTTNRKHRHHHHIHRSNPTDESKQINIQKRIDDAFNELNTNDDEYITKDEFIDWYIRSGLLADNRSNEINIPDTHVIQEIDKKNRKNKRLQNKEDNSQSRVPLKRYMSQMTEKKAHANTDEDDDLNDDDDNDNEQDEKQAELVLSDDSDSHYSIENERWQHLFNSVLQQIRSQRSNSQDNGQALTADNFRSWKQQGEERLKLEYYRQKTNEYSKSPEIIRIRL